MIRVSSLSACLLVLVGCSGGGETPSDAGTDGGQNVGDSGLVTCNATGSPNTIIANYTGMSLSVVGQDAYYIDRSANGSRGALHHVGLDGSNDTVVIDSLAGVLAQATAVGADIYYFQTDKNDEMHLFKTSRATGGEGTQIGTATYGLGGAAVTGGIFGFLALHSMGVFAVQGTDLFINDGNLSRVSMTTGAKTQLTSSMSLWPRLVGSNVVFRDSAGGIFSVPANATAPSAGTPIGTQKCGTGNYLWMAASANPTSGFGFACGDPFGLVKLDGTAATKTAYINTITLGSKDERSFNPSEIDGNTFYALPQLGSADTPIYKVDTATSSLTPVACNVRMVIDSHLTSTDLVFVEARGDNAASTTFSLKRLVR